MYLARIRLSTGQCYACGVKACVYVTRMHGGVTGTACEGLPMSINRPASAACMKIDIKRDAALRVRCMPPLGCAVVQCCWATDGSISLLAPCASNSRH
jgi:hypothetical protein